MKKLIRGLLVRCRGARLVKRLLHGLSFLLFGTMPVVSAWGQSETKWGLSAGCTLLPTCWPYFCNGVGMRSGPAFRQDLGTALSTSVSADFASAGVAVQMHAAGDVFFPEFRGTNSTASTGLYWASARASVIEGYRHTGTTPKTFLFGATMSGISSGPRSQDGLHAELAFFRSTRFVYLTDLPTLLYESGARVITNRSFRVATAPEEVSVSEVVEVPVAPGETFYLYASLDLNVFAQGAQCRTASPYQVFCLNSEGLVSESLRTDVPVSVRVNGGDLQIRWPVTRRSWVPESASAPGPLAWRPVAHPVTSDREGSLLTVPITGPQQFFRLRIP